MESHAPLTGPHEQFTSFIYLPLSPVNSIWSVRPFYKLTLFMLAGNEACDMKVMTAKARTCDWILRSKLPVSLRPFAVSRVHLSSFSAPCVNSPRFIKRARPLMADEGYKPPHPNTPSSIHHALRPRTTLHTRFGCACCCKPCKEFFMLFFSAELFAHITSIHRLYPNKNILSGIHHTESRFFGNAQCCQHSLFFSI